jgi:histidine ammonia-lyase
VRLRVAAHLKANRLAQVADVIAAMSLDAYDGRTEPFHASVHAVRPHPGQAVVAGHARSAERQRHREARQETCAGSVFLPLCMPQVHGASRDAIAYVERVVERELESVTDNPTVFEDEDLIVSAGNFHGQPLALALDFLAIALAEFGSISERRTYKLSGGQRGLPAFLVARIPASTAAS